MPLPWPPLFSPSALSAAATAECAPTQLTALPLPWPPRFPPPTLSAAFPKSTPIQPPQANTTLLTRASNSPSHAPKFHHASSPAVYLPPKKAVAPQSMPIKAKPLHLEKPQAAMTNTPAVVAQAAPDLQLLNRQPHPYSHLHCTGSCIPDLGDDCVACLDQSSVQRPSSASHSGPTPLPAITQGPPEERTSTIPAILAAMRPNGQPHQRPQTQLAQPPALSDNSSSRRSEVQCQAVKLDQRPNALPHSMPQKSLKMHLCQMVMMPKRRPTSTVTLRYMLKSSMRNRYMPKSSMCKWYMPNRHLRSRHLLLSCRGRLTKCCQDHLRPSPSKQHLLHCELHAHLQSN